MENEKERVLDTKKKQLFIIKLAKALHRYGTPAHRLEGALSSVSDRLGLIAEYFSMPTSILASFKDIDSEQTYMERVIPGDTHFEKLCAVDYIGEQVSRGKMDIETGSKKLDKIVDAPTRYGPFTRAISYTISSSLLIFYLNGNIHDFIFALIMGFFVGLLMNYKKILRIPDIADALSAFLTAVCAGLYLNQYPQAHVSTILVAPLVILLPGLDVTTSLQELATKNLTSGTARLMGAIMDLLKLSFGLYIGVKLSSLFVTWQAINTQVSVTPLWLKYSILPLSALGFMISFRAHPRDYVVMLLALFIGLTSITLSKQFLEYSVLNLGREMSLFSAAMIVGISSNLYARTFNRPSSLVFVPGIILLVPGIIGLQSFSFFYKQDFITGMQSVFTMFSSAFSIVIGIFAGNVFVKPRTYL